MNEADARRFAELAVKKLCDETSTPCLKINLTDTKPLLYQSKIGGTPYLPKDSEIPTDRAGKQMKLLAQINCEDLQQLDGYPHLGILQFWLTTDYAWSEYSVKYYSFIDYTLTEEAVLPRIQEFIDGVTGGFPVNGEYGVEFTLANETMSRDDRRLEALFCQYYTEISGEYISCPEEAGKGKFGNIVYEVFESYCDSRAAYGGGSKIGGYESSAQLPEYYTYQPKEYASQYNDKWKTYVDNIDMKAEDTSLLLFQLDSHSRGSGDYKVLWGDLGVARFYITRHDLESCYFRKVGFRWDCS